MPTSLKAQLIMMKAEEDILAFLEKNGPSRPFLIGLRCIPGNNKKEHYRQWANRYLLRLQQRDLVTSFKNDFGEVFYKIKDDA